MPARDGPSSAHHLPDGGQELLIDGRGGLFYSSRPCMCVLLVCGKLGCALLLVQSSRSRVQRSREGVQRAQRCARTRQRLTARHGRRLAQAAAQRARGGACGLDRSGGARKLCTVSFVLSRMYTMYCMRYACSRAIKRFFAAAAWPRRRDTASRLSLFTHASCAATRAYAARPMAQRTALRRRRGTSACCGYRERSMSAAAPRSSALDGLPPCRCARTTASAAAGTSSTVAVAATVSASLAADAGRQAAPLLANDALTALRLMQQRASRAAAGKTRPERSDTRKKGRARSDVMIDATARQRCMDAPPPAPSASGCSAHPPLPSPAMRSAL